VAVFFTVRFLVKVLFQTRTPTSFAIYCLLFSVSMIVYNV
jgi:hypothetical protein